MNLDLAALRIGQRYDVFFGGMQGPMKFPNPLLLEVLWRAFLRTGTPQFSQIIFTTLDGILFGGTYDHIGGGFFRHSMDERWLEPSFEKMLYDQAQMIDLCTQIWQFNRNELCRQRVTETIGFLLRDMRVGDAFAAAISSGSQTEDGKYYTWSEAEIDAALVGTFSARFKQVYGITRDGNVMGRNLPRRLGNPAPASEADEALLAKQREMLLAARDKRTRAAPRRPRAGRLEWPGHRRLVARRHGVREAGMDEAAITAFDAVVEKPGRRGRHAVPFAGAAGVADDYADMARAALQLWEVTGDRTFPGARQGLDQGAGRSFLEQPDQRLLLLCRQCRAAVRASAHAVRQSRAQRQRHHADGADAAGAADRRTRLHVPRLHPGRHLRQRSQPHAARLRRLPRRL